MFYNYSNRLVDIDIQYDLEKIYLFKSESLSLLYRKYLETSEIKDQGFFISLLELGYNDLQDINISILELLEYINKDVSNHTMMLYIHIVTVSMSELDYFHSLLRCEKFDIDSFWSKNEVACIKDIFIIQDIVKFEIGKFYNRRK